MTVLGLTADGKKIVTVTSSISASPANITVNELNRIDAVLFAFASGGYAVGAYSISGNVVSVTIYQYNYPASSAGPATAISGSVTTSVTLIVIGN